jgi:hypothetical protein
MFWPTLATCLLCDAAEMLGRLPFFRRAATSCHASLPRTRSSPPTASPSQGCSLCVLLLLLRASVGGARLPTAALAVPLACLPFLLTAHVLVRATLATVLVHAGDGIGHCAYPAYATTSAAPRPRRDLPAAARHRVLRRATSIAAVAINRRCACGRTGSPCSSSCCCPCTVHCSLVCSCCCARRSVARGCPRPRSWNGFVGVDCEGKPPRPITISRENRIARARDPARAAVRRRGSEARCRTRSLV